MGRFDHRSILGKLRGSMSMEFTKDGISYASVGVVDYYNEA